MDRVIAYIDGFNLYFGMRERGWYKYYWLDLSKLVQDILSPGQTLQRVKYFTARVKAPKAKAKRQNTYLEALGTLPTVKRYYGHYLSDDIVCNKCGNTWKTHHEKMTDVNIAVQMMLDGFRDRLDAALLVSADSDLVGPIRAVQNLPSPKRVVVAFPPERRSHMLKKTANGYLVIGENSLRKSQFPDQVTKPDGFVLQRPSTWK